jgi:hypothetical protein
MCETLSSIISPDNLIDSSNFCGIKKGIKLVGNDDLKSSNAVQHLVVVDQGAMYLLPPISKRWTPSVLKVERSPLIIRDRDIFCSSTRVGVVLEILDHRNWSLASNESIGS